jgi:mono/diheme cytochrome c family protein
LRKSCKIALASLAAFGIAVVLAGGAITWLTDRKMHRRVALPPVQVTFTATDGQLAHGEYLFNTRGCMECHGADGGGHVVIDDKDSGFFVRAPNITSGVESPARAYTDADWVRALRHGVKPSGEPLQIMPSDEYAHMIDADVAAIAAYVRSLPPKNGGAAEFSPWPLPFKALYVLGVVKDAAERIDHAAAAPAAVPDDKLARGKYIAQACTGCHGPHFSGGKIPGTPPSWPAASNLTAASDSAMARYTSLEQFKAMFRTGKRPDGSAVSEVMPFKSLAHMNDAELDALFAFLQSLQPRPSGQR